MDNGTYQARACKAELGQTNGGKDQVGIDFELTQEGFEGQHFTYYGTFGEASLNITLKALRTAGFEGLDLSDLSSVERNRKAVALVIENEEYNGQVRAKVKWVNSLGGVAMKTVMNDVQKKSFAAQMKGALIAFDQEHGTAPASAPKANGASKPQAQAQATMPPEEIPF